VYAKLNASILRTAALLIAGLVISALAALALARGMVRPIRTLDEGARRIAAGELDQKIEVRTGDELQALANQFNRMTGRLRESYAGLERKVEERTQELRDSLEQQTAISEILRVISSSPTDVKPVLQAVAERAAHLCDAPFARVFLIDGNELRLMTDHSSKDEPLSQPAKPLPLKRSIPTARAVLDRQTIHHADVLPLLDTEYPDSRELNLAINARAVLAVPLIREGGAYGGIFLFRREPGLFSSAQVALVETFARQAAIAIDNVRLFNETTEALEQQTAVAEILRVISSSPTDVQPVLDAIAERAARLCDAAAASMYLTDGSVLRHLASKGPSPDPVSSVEVVPINRDSISGRALLEGRTIVVDDMLAAGADYPLSLEIAQRHAARTIVVVPLSGEGKPFGTIVLRRHEVRPFTERELALLQTFGDQAAIALKNVRLFEEIQEKSRQVEIASQHKMQFLANMSHELRTPLNAILGYAELLFDGIYGALDDRVRGVLDRVQHNGKHLLGLINDVLDLSKIDAGQLTLSLDGYSMSSLVKSTVASTESLARAKGLVLQASVDEGLPLGWGDERRLTQVLLNIVGNAIKFTDQGKVEVIATVAGGNFNLDVRDTGPGIAEADQARIFEEFQQVDLSSTRTKGGTGLGLAIAKRIVEMHGGTITVTSELGVGSTFHVVVPIRVEQQKEAA
jgi:signal transduction histidine kinase